MPPTPPIICIPTCLLKASTLHIDTNTPHLIGPEPPSVTYTPRKTSTVCT